MWGPETHPEGLTWGFALGCAVRLGRCEAQQAARFYRLVRLVIDLLVLRGRRDRSKDAEILVLRHQIAVLHLWGTNSSVGSVTSINARPEVVAVTD